MKVDPEQRYAVIDTVSGEEVERHKTRPGELEDALVQAERQLRSTNARLTRMQRDQEAEARQHKRWDEAEAVHTWWRLATGHYGVRFDAEAFQQVLPRLKEVGPIEVLRAVAGAAFDPGTKTQRNGAKKRFDDWELINRSAPKLRDFAGRAPGCPVQEHRWKRWLIERIEINLGLRDNPEDISEDKNGSEISEAA